MILFLNGCSSAGKSALARALQYSWEGPSLTLGVDTFLRMMPPHYVGHGDQSKEGIYFTSLSEEVGPKIKIENGPFGKKLFSTVPNVIKLLAQEGYDLIIDEVLVGETDLKHYITALQNFSVYFVGVTCDLKIMEEREILRGNRMQGLARGQVDDIQSLSSFYDVMVDTTRTSSFECAQKILEYVRKNAHPSGFKQLEKIFKI